MKFNQLGVIVSSAVLAVSAYASTPTHALAPVSKNAEVTVVTHLDIARTGLDRALGLFGGYATASRREPGNVSTEVLRQVNANNHFTLVEIWSTRAAYDKHISAETARSFHQQLDPLLGSPHDERLFVSESN